MLELIPTSILTHLDGEIVNRLHALAGGIGYEFGAACEAQSEE